MNNFETIFLYDNFNQKTFPLKKEMLRWESVKFNYLALSADPLSPPTVENLTPIGVFFPISLKTLALQYLVMSWVTSKYPNAPEEYK